VLFKSRYSDESFSDDRIKETTKYNMDLFIDYIKNLTLEKLQDVFNIKNDDKENHYIEYMLKYFSEHNISFSSILEMIKNDFSSDKILYANETNEKLKADIIKNLNTLELSNNQYRAIFDCNTLTEGWDVLNLFDIVRLYETRQGGQADSTITEAQLIGRGARYYPFLIDKNENPERAYIRKYEKNDKNPLYFCEAMFYHCYSDSSYISELRNQLKEQGIYNDDDKKQIVIKVKKSFMNTPLYRDGYFFNNSQIEIRNTENKISNLYSKFPTQFNGYIEGASSENLIEGKISSVNSEYKTIKIKDIAKFNYFLIRKHMITQNTCLRFDKLKEKYPSLEKLSDFINKDEYLGNFEIDIKTSNDKLGYDDFNTALPHFFRAINDIIKNESKYTGSKKFTKIPIKDVLEEDFKVSVRKIDDNCGVGVSQNDDKCANFKKTSNLQPYNMKKDLSTIDWYVFEDNIGTTEEKAFVYEFSKRYDDLCKCFDIVRLIRNEEKLKLYRFDDGEGFKPDFILILKKKNEQASFIQIFFEPKGIHLMKYDEKKEKFLFAISEDKEVDVETIIGQSNEILGAPFFNMDYERNKDFNDFINKLIEDNSN
jgi:type III restriction enzyme